MITEFNIYEQNIFTYLDGRFILKHYATGLKRFSFIYSMNKESKLADHLDFNCDYYGDIELVSVSDIRLTKDEFMKIEGHTLIKPDDFYRKYPKICKLLYYELKGHIKRRSLMGYKKLKYKKLLKTLENIKELEIDILSKKYNL